jgi:excisionase family DNA binding protein
MRTITNRKQERRKPSSEWHRHKNTVPLTERGVFKIAEAADYLGQSLTRIRRLVTDGQLNRLPGSRHILIARAECDRWIREQSDIAKFAA